MMTKPNLKNRISKPPWLKVKPCGNNRYLKVRSLLREHNLHTVCQEANCPNRGECFSSGTATFLILGPNCTRNCRFCNIIQGNISPINDNEPQNVARAIDILDLKHAVVTSVTRDDLADGGAAQFAAVTKEIRALDKDVTIEVLTPDFKGRRESIEKVLDSSPDVFNHNVETVPRLYREIRPDADYHRSLEILKIASEADGMAVKSGLMVGLGETVSDLRRVFTDLKSAGVDYLTIGQYLSPSKRHYPVIRYYHPSEFEMLGALARKQGIKSVFSGPLVRSSYHAEKQYRR